MFSRVASVLVIDDDPRICGLIEDVLPAHHCRCVCVHSGDEGRRHLLAGRYDVTVLDLTLADSRGACLMDFISRRRIDTRVIIMTGADVDGAVAEARRAGAWAFFKKPFDVFLLAEAVRRAAGIDPALAPAAVAFCSQSPSRLIFPDRPAQARIA